MRESVRPSRRPTIVAEMPPCRPILEAAISRGQLEHRCKGQPTRFSYRVHARVSVVKAGTLAKGDEQSSARQRARPRLSIESDRVRLRLLTGRVIWRGACRGRAGTPLPGGGAGGPHVPVFVPVVVAGAGGEAGFRIARP